MINALTAIMNYLETDADLTLLIADRIAAKHKYGASGGWTKGAKSLVLSQRGGDPNLYSDVQQLRLDARCYGERQREASRVYNQLIAICRAFIRTTVSTGDGLALIYELQPASGPDVQFDPDLELDFIQLFLTAAVSEVAV